MCFAQNKDGDDQTAKCGSDYEEHRQNRSKSRNNVKENRSKRKDGIRQSQKKNETRKNRAVSKECTKGQNAASQSKGLSQGKQELIRYDTAEHSSKDSCSII
mmetsp:Transcript_14655/g.26554  ORF Transcript_14655/g.26554 Transcript_14655/m.26554 type:complete len:102 (-) Transcript_14655:356-661(-)